MLQIVKETLERSLITLQEFDCPSHHREHYERTESTLRYLLQPDTLHRVIFVDKPTFAPLCADMVPDSGVCFLRRTAAGPRDLASDLQRGALNGATLFLQLWDDALGIDYAGWRELADQAPAIFVRLGESVQNEEGRWHWAAMRGAHQAISYPDISAAFAALIGGAEHAGETERAHRLKHWQYGVLDLAPA